jgi:hypothetical protein
MKCPLVRICTNVNCNTRQHKAAIRERVIHPQGKMTVATARRIAQLDFSSEEHSRMHELAVKNQSGMLTVEVVSELDNYCRVGTTLSILQSRARQVWKPLQKIS